MQSSTTTSPALSPIAPESAACPSVDTLEAFLEERLPPGAATRLATHLDACRRCQSVAEQWLSRSTWTDRLFPIPESPQTAAGASVLTGTDPGLAMPTVATGSEVAGFRPAVQPGAVLAERFELRRMVGIGGFGTVFEAWDRQLRRDVAVKVPYWQLCEKPSLRKRFRVEARAAARLSHPQIVPVYEACIEDAGTCYLVSELIHGPSLESWMSGGWTRGSPIPVDTAARLIALLARGVAYAHAAGVLHRDLKPGNILLAPAAQGGLDFTPRITDFGIARLSDEGTQTTSEGAVFGSLHYMAPEQAAGRPDVGPGCDIYALGVMLYELLTGRLPIEGDSPTVVLQAISAQPVVSPRRWRREIPADLEAVCLKCLEKRPQDRYRTAAELALDIERFLTGVAVSARLPRLHEQAVRWARRHPTATAVLGTVTVAVLLVVGVLADANHRQATHITEVDRMNQQLETTNTRLGDALQTADQMRRHADRMRRQAEQQRRTTQEGLYVSEVRRAFQLWQERDLSGLQRILDRLEQPEFSEFRGVECDWLRTKLVRPHRELTRFPRAAYTVAFAPDGERLATGGRDSLVRLIRYRDAALLAEWETGQREINGVAFSPDGKSLWTSGDDGTLCQWDLETRSERQRIPAHAPEQAHDLHVVPGQNLLISTGTDGRIRLWDAATGADRGSLVGHDRAINSLAMDAAGERLFSASLDGKICGWRLSDLTLQSTWTIPDLSARALVLSQDGRRLVVSVSHTQLEIRDSSTGAVLESHAPLDDIKTLIRHPAQDFIYAVDVRGVIHEFGLSQTTAGAEETSAPQSGLRSLGRMSSGRTFQCVLSPVSGEIVTCSSDGRVANWPLRTLDAGVAIAAAAEDVRKFTLAADGETLVTTNGQDLTRRSAGTLESIDRVDVPGRRISSVAAFSDGDVVTAEVDPQLRGWLVRRRITDVEPVSQCFAGTVDRSFLSLRPISGLNLLLFLNFGDPAVRFATLEPLESIAPLRLRGSTRALAVDSSQSRFAHAEERRISVRETTSRELCWSAPQSDPVSWMQFSHDGRFLVVATENRVLSTWEAASGRPLQTMVGHRGEVLAGALSRDGRTLFSGDSDGELRVWHVATGDLLGTIDLQSPVGIYELVLSPAEDRLYVRRTDRSLQMAPLKP